LRAIVLRLMVAPRWPTSAPAATAPTPYVIA
jgi:hypothetical protein